MPPTMRNGRSIECLSARAKTRAEGVLGWIHPIGPRGCAQPSSPRWRQAYAVAGIAGSDRVPARHQECFDRSVSADAPHLRDDLVDDLDREASADDAGWAECLEAAGADADDLPADLAERLVFLEVGGFFQPEVRAPRATGIVVLDGNAQLRHEDVWPDLLLAVEHARDAHGVHSVVETDAFAEEHAQSLLDL